MGKKQTRVYVRQKDNANAFLFSRQRTQSLLSEIQTF